MTAATAQRPPARHGIRPVLVLRALAASEVPLTTRNLVDLVGEGIPGYQKAVAWYCQILCRHMRNGRAERVGRTAGKHRAGPSYLWQVTPAGREWLAGHEAVAP